MALTLTGGRGPRTVLACDLYDAWAARLASASGDRVIPTWQELPDEVRAAWHGLNTDLAAGRIHA